ncbi:DUF1311 domain-containing protein [Jannaschia sp. S6380]|uniref:lysozyme inhibitor LprI family protein n=1 Tax=Jannaschia sp. S6380 TaxID=2926408 RepID=UPI001FF5C0C9|nr:lysozyme inhibitor LprI family protein [Jannaschia sp. S6380]MCK0166821.1 DUF1311 domain-containing protein [Jannaschia sp. S6380]
MKITLLLSSLLLLLSNPAVAQDPSRLLNLEKCWEGGLPEQLLCFDREFHACDIQLEHLGTGEGRYMCYAETLVQADLHLNRVYARVIEKARQDDVEDGMYFREDILRDAQRKWVSYRDAQSQIGPSWARIMGGFESAIAFEAARITIVQAHTLSELDKRY